MSGMIGRITELASVKIDVVDMADSAQDAACPTIDVGDVSIGKELLELRPRLPASQQQTYRKTHIATLRRRWGNCIKRHIARLLIG